MTNLEYIRNLSARDIAALLIRTVEETDYDEDIYGEMVECGSRFVFYASDGSVFWDYDNALDYETAWLLREQMV